MPHYIITSETKLTEPNIGTTPIEADSALDALLSVRPKALVEKLNERNVPSYARTKVWEMSEEGAKRPDLELAATDLRKGVITDVRAWKEPAKATFDLSDV